MISLAPCTLKMISKFTFLILDYLTPDKADSVHKEPDNVHQFGVWSLCISNSFFLYIGLYLWNLERPFIHIRRGIYDTKTVMTYIYRAVNLGASELLLRGSKLKNTSWIFGVVVYTGEESKLRLNSVKTPLKRSHIEKLTNIQVHHLYCTCMWIGMLFCPHKLIKKLLSKFVLVAIPNRSDCSTFFNNAMNVIL